jgi:hypothetical protein
MLLGISVMSFEHIINTTLVKLESVLDNLNTPDSGLRPNMSEAQLERLALQGMSDVILEAYEQLDKEAVSSCKKKKIKLPSARNKERQQARDSMYRSMFRTFHPDKNIQSTLMTKIEKHGIKTDVLNLIKNHRTINDSFWKQNFDKIREAKEKNDYFFYAYRRYYQPIKFIAKYANKIVDMILILLGVVALLGIGLMEASSYIISWISEKALNLVLGNKMEEAVDTFKSEPANQKEAKKKYLDRLKNEYINAAQEELFAKGASEKINPDTVTEIELFNYAVKKMIEEIKMVENKDISEEEATKRVMDEIKKLPLDHFNYLTLATKTIFNSMSRALLPGRFFNNAFSIVVVRPLQLLLASAFLALYVIAMAIEKINNAVKYLASGVIIGMKAVSILLIHGPIYVYDAISFVFSCMFSCCFKSSHLKNDLDAELNSETAPVPEASYNAGPSALTRLGKHQTNKKPRSEEPAYSSSFPVDNADTTHRDKVEDTSDFRFV